MHWALPQIFFRGIDHDSHNNRQAIENDYQKNVNLKKTGFALGIAAEIATQFPTWGRKFQAVIIACVIVNQMIGPVLCKVCV